MSLKKKKNRDAHTRTFGSLNTQVVPGLIGSWRRRKSAQDSVYPLSNQPRLRTPGAGVHTHRGKMYWDIGILLYLHLCIGIGIYIPILPLE